MPTPIRVGATTLTTPARREIVTTRAFDAPNRLVVEAHTGAERLPNRKLGPQGWTVPVCGLDLRPGGAWHFVRRDDGAETGTNGARL